MSTVERSGQHLASAAAMLRTRWRIWLVVVGLLLLPRVAGAQSTTFFVTNTNDSGAGSLRQAITDADASSGSPLLIVFQIPTSDPGYGAGVFTIKPLSALPILRNNIVLDGGTQTAFTGDTNPDGPQVVIDGSAAGSASGLVISGDNNQISGFVVQNFSDGAGIYIVYTIDGTPSGNKILDNYVGTDASGTLAAPNAYGVDLHGFGSPSMPAQGNIIAGNLISANIRDGISLCDTRQTLISNNRIGAGRTDGDLKNGAWGIRGVCVGVVDSQIVDNVIAFNVGDGVELEPDYRSNTTYMTGNSIRRNAIYANGGLGINLLPPPFGTVDGVTPNDAGDADTGANNLQNYPVLSGALSNGSATVISGTLNSTPSTTYVVDFYSNSASDPSGHGEGELYLTTITVTTDAGGNAALVAAAPTGVPAGAAVAATATDLSGNTSEFSNALEVGALNANAAVPAAPALKALSDTWFSVSAPYLGDANGDSYAVVEYGTSTAGPWQLGCSGLVAAPAWRICPFFTLTAGADYYVRVTYADPDGVYGVNPQLLGPVHTLASQPNSVQFGAWSIELYETSFLVSVDVSQDSNYNSQLTVETAPSATGPWTVKCAAAGTFSPKLCGVHGLVHDTDYWVRATLSDPDGVAPVSSQIQGPVHYNGPTDLALGKPVTADPGWGCCTNPAEMVNGTVQDASWQHGYAYMGGLQQWGGGAPGWKQATVDLGGLNILVGAALWSHQSTAVPQVWKLEASSDGVTFTEVYSNTRPICRTQTAGLHMDYTIGNCSAYAALQSPTARYLRYSFDDRTTLDGMHAWVQEIEVFGAPAPSVTVPNLVGLTQSAAEAALRSLALAVVEPVASRPDPTVPSGVVLKQNPAAGSSVAPGSAVSFTVSSGPPLITVPNVVGKSLDEAVSILAQAGLTNVTKESEPSATVAAGQIIRQTPEPGTSVPAQTVVDLVQSLGPNSCTNATRLVPGVPTKGILTKATDVIFYELDITQSSQAVLITLIQPDRDYDVFIYKNCSQPGSDGSIGQAWHVGQARHVGEEHVYFSAGLYTGTMYIAVRAGAGSVSAAPYTLKVDLAPDTDEPNNSCQYGTQIAPGATKTSYLSTPQDLDYFKIYVDKPYSVLTATLHNSVGNYDLELDNACAEDTGQDWQFVTGTASGAKQRTVNVGAAAGWFYIFVHSFNNDFGSTPYQLDVTLTPPSASGTLIVMYRTRLVAHYGSGAEGQLYGRLTQLAQHAAVLGEILDLSQDPAAVAAYAQWDTMPDSPAVANTAAQAVRQAIQARVSAAPSIRNIVLVGGDRQIPFHRTVIQPPEGDPNWVSENTYVDPSWNHQDPTTAALYRDYTLSDDFYASPEGLPFAGHLLYVPNVAIGRLVETPEEMAAAVDFFLANDGMLRADSALSVGSQFMVDSAAVISDTFGQMGLAPGHMVGNGWTAEALRVALGLLPNLASVQTHSNHYSFLAPDNSVLLAGALKTTLPSLAKLLLYSPGCHVGLSVSSGNSANDLDLAQVMVGRGAALLANTGWGYGDDSGISWSEELMQIFTNQLAEKSTVTVGDALYLTKRAYYIGQPGFNYLDEKVMSELTLYGLPMLRISTANPIAQISQAPADSHEGARDGAMVGSVSSSMAVSGDADGVTYEDRLLYLTTSRFAKHEVAGRGSYYTYGGESTSEADAPIQPRAAIETFAPSSPAHGAVLLSAAYITETDFDPVYVAPSILNSTTATEPTASGQGWTPAQLVGLNRLSSVFGNGVEESFVVDVGQYDLVSKVERRYEQVTARLYRSDSSDWTPPTISDMQCATGGNDKNVFHVKAADDNDAGIVAVIVAYTDGKGRWQSTYLTQSGGEWVGTCAPERGQGPNTAVVQVVDKSGNVTTATWNVAVSPRWPIYLPAIQKYTP